MPTGLLDLPIECIDRILSYLQPFEIKRVALTFNRHLSILASPIITQCLQKFDDDETQLESFFGKIDPATSPYANKKARHCAYLNSTHSLDRVDARGGVEQKTWEDCFNVDQANLDRLADTASKLGLTLPPTFIDFFRGDRWNRVFSMTDDIYISGLGKVWAFPRLKSEDGDTGTDTDTDSNTDTETDIDFLQTKEVYVISFWEDQQQGCYNHTLYLDKAGRHAVLHSPSDCELANDSREEYAESELAILTDVEKALGVSIGRPLDGEFLLDINFEHWLRNVWPWILLKF